MLPADVPPKAQPDRHGHNNEGVLFEKRLRRLVFVFVVLFIGALSSELEYWVEDVVILLQLHVLKVIAKQFEAEVQLVVEFVLALVVLAS